MNIIDDYSLFDDINAHQFGVDFRTFFEPINNRSGYQIPPLSDVLDVGCRVYAIQDPEIREAMLSAAAAQFGMDKSQLKHLISLYTHS